MMLSRIRSPRLSSSIAIVNKTGRRGLAREPPLPPLTNPIENAIEAARQRGEFNNLTGSGKPLPKGESVPAMVGGMSPSDLLSKKAEFEMRRSIRNNELDNLVGEGEKLKYKGTSISPSISGGGGGDGSSPGVMEKYILDQSNISADDMKKK